MSWLFSKALMEAYGNSPSSPERGAEFLGGNSSDGEPSAQLSVMDTPHKFWHKDKTMECSNLSRFGLTCVVLTESHGTDLLTWYREGFPARTYQGPVEAKESTAHDLDFGEKWRGSLAKYDRDTFLWKTAQSLLLGDWEEFSETWPRWGLMRDGECWALDMLEPPICGSVSGYWPTPTTVGKSGGSALCKWGGSHARAKLRTMVTERELNGPLNPEWVSWLMGWPRAWSSLTPLETGKFQEWRQQHGIYSEDQ